jgi:restriction system protein
MVARTRSTRRKSRRKTNNQKQTEQNVILGILFTGFVINSFVNHPVWIAPTAVLVVSFFFAYKRITRYHHRRKLLLKDLDDLSSDGYEFEERIRLLLVDLGWKDIRRVGGGGDGGVDLVAWYGKYKYIVQCKYYQSGKSVGSPAIRDLIGAKEDQKAYQALFVTSSHFSEPARETATRNGIKLWDREEIGRKLQTVENHKQTPEVKLTKSLQEYAFWVSLLVINITTTVASFLYFEGGL